MSAPLLSSLASRGHVLVRAPEMRPLLESAGTLSDWDAFAASWERLPEDGYMADGGRYRRRRHATYAAERDSVVERRPHQPHYQSRDYNPLNGGVVRLFEPIEPEIGDGPTLRTVLTFCRSLFDGAAPPEVRSWHVEVHQFRIEATGGTLGKPTPEGRHQDGVDYVLVMLVHRQNVASGTTTIHATDGRDLGSFTLTAPLDAVLIDDARIFHGVTPVHAIDAGAPAFRDVLVVTFRRA